MITFCVCLCVFFALCLCYKERCWYWFVMTCCYEFPWMTCVHVYSEHLSSFALWLTLFPSCLQPGASGNPPPVFPPPGALPLPPRHGVIGQYTHIRIYRYGLMHYTHERALTHTHTHTHLCSHQSTCILSMLACTMYIFTCACVCIGKYVYGGWTRRVSVCVHVWVPLHNVNNVSMCVYTVYVLICVCVCWNVYIALFTLGL